MNNKKYVSQEFLEESILDIFKTKSFMSFSFSKILALILLELLPSTFKSFADIGLLLSGRMNIDSNYLLVKTLSGIGAATREYIKSREYKCMFKKGIEKNVCLDRVYGNIIKELKSKKKICRNAKDKKQCNEYIDKLIEKYESKQHELVDRY